MRNAVLKPQPHTPNCANRFSGRQMNGIEGKNEGLGTRATNGSVGAEGYESLRTELCVTGAHFLVLDFPCM